ncbi:MAG: AMP-binding protein, partial [Cyclobacteriaceae bacterium]
MYSYHNIYSNLSILLESVAGSIPSNNSILSDILDRESADRFTEIISHKIGEKVYPSALADIRDLSGLANYLLNNYKEGVYNWLKLPLEYHVKQHYRNINTEDFNILRKRFSQLRESARFTSEMNKAGRALFILSPPRSGSTLLRTMLAGNSNLFSPPELNLMPFDTLMQWKEANQGHYDFLTLGAIEAIAETKNIDELAAEEYLKDLAEKGMSVTEFYAFLQKEISPKILVDKSTGYVTDPSLLEKIENTFENPIYIHLLRHPLATIQSFAKMRIDRLMLRGKHSYTPRQLGEMVWTIGHGNIRNFLSSIPDHRKHKLTFEDLVNDPDKEMRAVCHLLDITYEARMTRPYSYTDSEKAKKVIGANDPKFFSFRKIDPSIATAWQKDISEYRLSSKSIALSQELGYNLASTNKPQIANVTQPVPDLRTADWQYDSSENYKSITRPFIYEACPVESPVSDYIAAAIRVLIWQYTGETSISVWHYHNSNSGDNKPIEVNNVISPDSRIDQLTSLETRLRKEALKNSSENNETAYQQILITNDQTLISDNTEYGICLIIDEAHASINLKYSTNSMSENRASYLLNHLQYIIGKTGQPAGHIRLIAEDEVWEETQGFNQTDVPFDETITLSSLFEKRALSNPDDVATGFMGKYLTYAELDIRANQIAHTLLEYGLNHGDPVALIAERGFPIMECILGILKAGGCYLPVDPRFPAERLAFMIEDSRTRLVLTNVDLDNLVIPETLKVLDIRTLDFSNADNTRPKVKHLNSSSPAYIIYTSGSTGKPKGVVVAHRPVVNRISWMQNMYPIDKKDTILQKTPLTFDVSVWELFWGALAGARQHLIEPGAEKDPAILYQSIVEERISVLHFVPGMLNSFLQYLLETGNKPHT